MESKILTQCTRNGHNLKSMARMVLLSIVLALMGHLSYAQGYVEGVSVNYEILPMKVKQQGGHLKMNASNLRLSTGVPIFLNSSHTQYLIVGGNIEWTHFQDFEREFDVENLYSISPTFGYTKSFNKKFTMSALLIPVYNSDFEDLEGSDFHFGALLRANYKTSDKFALKASLGFVDQFYGPQIIALIGFDWKVNERVRMFGEAPREFTASYTLSPKLGVGFHQIANNTSYSLSKQNRYVKSNYANVGLFAEYYVAKNWAIRGTVGYSMIRDIQIHNNTDKSDAVIDFVTLGGEGTSLNRSVEKGATFKVSLSYRVFTP